MSEVNEAREESDDIDFEKVAIPMLEVFDTKSAALDSERTGAHRFAERAVSASLPEVVEQPAELSEASEEVVPQEERKRRSAWSEEPSTEQQMLTDIDTVRLVKPQADVLRLSNPEELKKWNDILTKADGGAPSIVITESERNFYEGSYVIYVSFSRVEYKKI